MSDPVSGVPTPPSEPGPPASLPASPPAGPPVGASPYGAPPAGGYVPPAYGQPYHGQQPWPGAAYPPYAYPQRPSQAMAITALVLSFVFFIPLALLVAIGLAIAVLVRSRRGINHGRGKAITALVVAGLILVGWVALIVVAVTTSDDAHRDGSGHVTQSGTISVQRLRLGDCFDHGALPDDNGRFRITTVRVVPCAEPHDWEVFHTFSLTGDAYPGTGEVSRFSEGGCLDAIEPFLGGPLDHSGPEVDYLHPTAASWRQDDRLVQCVIGANGSQVTGTLRGTAHQRPHPSRRPGQQAQQS